jgi:NAD(P)-dependent dehydrogenase (short-subunit alcohol dehydrogenase family)
VNRNDFSVHYRATSNDWHDKGMQGLVQPGATMEHSHSNGSAKDAPWPGSGPTPVARTFAIATCPPRAANIADNLTVEVIAAPGRKSAIAESRYTVSMLTQDLSGGNLDVQLIVLCPMLNKQWNISDIAAQAGKRVVVTGANSGIGYHTAVTLARKGAQVVFACRDKQRGEEALARLDADSPGAHAALAILDLASLRSVRQFAQRELAQQRPLHILINNAGVMAPPKRLETADGFELQFGTNVLGHFALTALLMPALELAAAESSDRPRIVTIASIAHKRGELDFDDLQSTKQYSPMRSYRQSKLADLIFAFELDRRLRAAHSRVMSVAAHPGVANTNLFRGGDHSAIARALRNLLGQFIGIALNTDYSGALPTLYAATAHDVSGGGYYGPRGFLEARGNRVGAASVAKQARDALTAERLWQVCDDLTHVRFRP